MALIYSDLAIVSVGMSCQTAHQIRLHKDFLDRIVGQEGRLSATPFDWLICPAPSATKMLDAEQFFPDRRDDLELDDGHPRWHRTGACYWHEPQALNDFNLVRGKFDHLTNNWRGLAGRRILAFWSNTQANLRGTTARMNIDLAARRRDLAELEAALKRWFPQLKLFSIIASHRRDADDPPSQDTAFPYPGEDRKWGWKGKDEVWKEAFEWALASDGLKVPDVRNIA